ncbi:unnamed protein product [Discosporangium mesarthrocarpum]
MSTNATLAELISALWGRVEDLEGQLFALQGNVTSVRAVVEQASDDTALESLAADMDTFWLMWGGILVVSMQAGFSLVEVGSVSVKHTKNLLIKNMLDLCVASVAWWICGYGIAYGSTAGDSKRVYGKDSFFLNSELFHEPNGSFTNSHGYQYAGWFFSWTFSGAAATIASGAVGERITTAGYFAFATLMASFIYPVVVHWGWSADGWASAWSTDSPNLLLGCGTIDFAGSGVVHTTGAAAGLTLLVFLGPRIGRYRKNEVNPMPKQSVTMQVLGTFILLVGWYGFNGVSTLYITGLSHVAAKSMVTTTLAASAGGIGTAIVGMILFHHTSPEEINNGVLSGLVSITAGCSVVESEAAFIVGAVAACIYMGTSRLMIKLKVDDMVDAVAVHGANGIWGMIAAALFATSENYAISFYADRAEKCCGLFYGCGFHQLLANLLFVSVVVFWVTGCTSVLCILLKYLQILRIRSAIELGGTDTFMHGGEEVPEYVHELVKKAQRWAEKGYDSVDTRGSQKRRSISLGEDEGRFNRSVPKRGISRHESLIRTSKREQRTSDPNRSTISHTPASEALNSPGNLVGDTTQIGDTS